MNNPSVAVKPLCTFIHSPRLELGPLTPQFVAQDRPKWKHSSWPTETEHSQRQRGLKDEGSGECPWMDLEDCGSCRRKPDVAFQDVP